MMIERLFSRWIAAFGSTVLFTTCVAMGWKFGPGFSLTDKPLGEALFARPPVVEYRADGYFLTWTQGDYPFFFQPDYKVMDSRLVLAMVATSSSGNLSGRYREMKIEGADNFEALRRGGAFWWEREPEPDGRFIRLEIREGPNDPQAESVGQRPVYRFSDNWGSGSGCTPKGEVLSLEGTIVIRPFGKGTDGAVLKTNTDEWVVSYRAEGPLLEMRDKRVLARGRVCEKQGEAVAGKHFDLMTLTEVPTMLPRN